MSRGCPRCGYVIGEATWCLRCGWRDDPPAVRRLSRGLWLALGSFALIGVLALALGQR